MIILWVTASDFLLYLFLRGNNSILSSVKFILLSVNICVFLTDLFTIYYFQFPLNSVMLEVLTVSNFRETGEFIQAYAFNIHFWLFMAFIGVLVFAARQFFRLLCARKVLLLILLLAGSSMGVFAAYHEVIIGKGYERFLSSAAPVRLIYMAHNFYSDKRDLQEAMNEELTVTTSGKDNAIPYVVFILGEATGRNHLSLYGYSLRTNPLLEKRRDEGSLCVFSDVISPHANTVAVLKKLLSFCRYDSKEDWFRYQSLFKILKAEGYYTAWVSNHERRPGWDPRTVYSKQCDYTDFPDKFKGSQYHSSTHDEKLLPIIDGLLSSSENAKNFYVIQLLGTHAHYWKRYPEEYGKFTARDETEGYSGITDEQKNNRAHYDNAVLYNDFVVNEIIRRFENLNAVVFYLSDHGEEVYDSMNVAGHGDGMRSRYTNEIPFMIWTSPKFRKAYPGLESQIASSINRPYMTDDMIHTVLDIMGIETPGYDPSKSIINPKFDSSRKRIYAGMLYDKENGLHEIQ